MVEIRSVQREDYILITTSGKIFDLEDYLAMPMLHYYEAKKYKMNRVIVDIHELEFPISPSKTIKTVKYIFDHPQLQNIWKYKVALIFSRSGLKIGKLFNLACGSRGLNFRVFDSIQEGEKWLLNKSKLAPAG